jgi:hypothetical protein
MPYIKAIRGGGGGDDDHHLKSFRQCMSNIPGKHVIKEL